MPGPAWRSCPVDRWVSMASLNSSPQQLRSRRAGRVRVEQLVGHFGRALDNGVTVDELTETITHLAFYAGWPRAMSAVHVLRKVVQERAGTTP